MQLKSGKQSPEANEDALIADKDALKIEVKDPKTTNARLRALHLDVCEGMQRFDMSTCRCCTSTCVMME